VWTLGPIDLAIAAGLLAVTLGVAAPIAHRYHQEAMALEREAGESVARYRMLQRTLEHVQQQRGRLTQLRRAVDRYVSDVEARPIVPWTTVMGELSRRRPRGLWTTRISGEGPRFTTQVTAERPELVQQYAEQLRESPYMEFAALPTGEVQSTRARLIGRAQGE